MKKIRYINIIKMSLVLGLVKWGIYTPECDSFKEKYLIEIPELSNEIINIIMKNFDDLTLNDKKAYTFVYYERDENNALYGHPCDHKKFKKIMLKFLNVSELKMDGLKV